MIPRLAPPYGLRDLALTFTAKGDVQQFETAFARLAGTKHAIAFPYGRTALLCLLEALGLSRREILCPSYTCVVVPHAIVRGDNIPVFIDSEKDGYLMDLELASEAVHPQTGAVIATSFFGEPVSLAALDAFSRSHPHVAVIQDCAHSFFCEDQGTPVHRQAVAAIYGLNISKLMTSVFGGMTTTDDDDLAARLLQVRARRVAPASLSKSIARRLYFAASRLALTPSIYSVVKWISRLGVLDRFIRYYEDDQITMPRDYLDGLTDFEAAIGTMQCSRYHELIEKRRWLAERYLSALKECSHLNLPRQVSGRTWSHFTVGTPAAASYLRAHAQQGIELGELLEYYIPDMKSYRSYRNLDRGVARSHVGNVVNLPLHGAVSPRVFAEIVRLMKIEHNS